MIASYDKNAAVVVLPPVGNGRLEDAGLKAWLAQSNLTDEPGPKELLARVVQEIGLPYPDDGLAALRMWGQAWPWLQIQTGETSRNRCAMFFIPIFALARAKPIVRTSVPPMSLVCAPKTCSTRTRTVDFVRLLPLACSVSGLPRLPLRWMWLLSFYARSFASVSSER